ncbi:MAG TPA: amino acid adenylation domain-containing protein [Pseudonocardiaceae bacterium]|nr:amino acid adenylation domain-containing protein [Pseudonocardiaceae bacterium]
MTIVDVYGLTPVQAGILFHASADPGDPAYLNHLEWTVSGPLDLDAYAAAFAALVDRHPVLRTSFHATDADEPLQAVHDSIRWQAQRHDLSGISAAARADALSELTGRLRATGMDPAEPGLMRLHLIRLATDSVHVLWTHHHLVLDGWSLAIAYADAMRHYDGLPAAARPRPFREHIAWLHAVDQEASREFWRDQLAGISPCRLALPRHAADAGYGRTERMLAAGTVDAVAALAGRCGVTVGVVLQLAWARTLARYSGTDDVVFGTTVSGRHPGEPGVEQMVGMFVNTVPVRVRLDRKRPVDTVLRDMLAVQAERADHEHAALTELFGAASLFDTLLVIENFPLGAALSDGGLLVTPVAATEHTHYPLTVTVLPGSRFRIEADYRLDVIRPPVADRILADFTGMLGELAHGGPPARDDHHHPDVPVGGHPQRSVVDLVLASVTRDPGAAAVVDACGAVLGYGELDDWSAAVAGELRARGTGAGDVVAISIAHTVEWPVAVLAVLRCGAAYLPLDPGSPPARARELAERAGAGLVLDAELVRAARTTVPIGELPAIHPAQPAYVIYTSGSTGTPKGVVVPHRALAAHARAIVGEYALTTKDRVLQFANPAFDVAAEELFPTWAAGATVVLRAPDTADTVRAFTGHLVASGVTVANVPAAFWAVWTAESTAIPPALRLVVVGNEPVWPAQARAWRPTGVRLRNAFGTTETTITTTLYRVPAELPDTDMVPIGTALPGMAAHILDRHLEPVPPGVIGDLFVGGTGVAHGYHRDPAQTAERFLPDPFGPPGARLYRTGDLGYRHDDAIVLVGRGDQQVQILGHRVEPAEVEAAISADPEVTAVAVLAVPDRQPRLVAYVVADDVDAVRDRIRRTLPAYLCPGRWVPMDQLPLLPSGKVDRTALPATAPGDPRTDSPGTATEQWLADTWLDLLGTAPGRRAGFAALGGHSLTATQLLGRIQRAFDVTVGLRELLAADQLNEQAELIDRARRESAGTAPPPLRPGDDHSTVSYTQERLWFLDELQHDGRYNVPTVWRLDGDLDVGRLRAALASAVGRHAALRTTFTARDGVAACRVRQRVPVDLVVEPCPDDAAMIDAILAEEAHRRFSLAQGPLFRFRLLDLGRARHLLVITVHHIVFDGWSHALLMDELAAHYRGDNLPEPSMQFGDYARWQRDWLRGDVLNGLLDFWRTALDGVPEHLALPTDRPRTADAVHVGANLGFELDTDLSAALRQLARDHDATLYVVLLAAFTALLHRYTAQDDLAVGTPVAGRTAPELDRLIGCFVNTLVLRSRLAPGMSFADFLDATRTTAYAAFDHQEAPYEKVVEAITRNRALDQDPLVQVMFVFQNTAHRRLDLPGLTVTGVAVPEQATLDLSLTMAVEAGTLIGLWEYDAALFDAATVAALDAALRVLLAAAVADPTTPVSRLPLVTDPVPAPPAPGESATLVDLFTAQVARTPTATAIDPLSYAEFHRQACGLAHWLRARGVRRGDRVGLCVAGDAALAVRIWGILLAGAAYVPLDFPAPLDRLAGQCGDAGIAVVLSQPDRVDALAGLPVTVCAAPDGAAPAGVAPPWDGELPVVTPADLAYVIFTSGSTGRPKPVGITHGGIANFVSWFAAEYGIGTHDRVLSHVRLGWDMSVMELLVPLVAGAAVVPADADQQADPAHLLDVVEAGGVTIVAATPTMLGMLTAEHRLPDCRALRLMVSGGEALGADVARAFAAQTRAALVNQYGPTEASVAVAHTPLTGPFPTIAPLGRPVAGCTVIVVGPSGDRLPVGAVGEIVIGGPQVAAGYLNAPALTADRFRPDPEAALPGARRYHSGDLGRLTAAGVLEYFGRVDRQVKVRGMRIEPAEVEAALVAHPAVSAAAVVAVGHDLVAHVVSSTDPATLRAHAQATLPPHLVPSHLVITDALPVTANHKIDYAALAARDLPDRAAAEGTAPRTDTERAVADVIAGVLGVPDLAADVDFFSIGGNSLLASRVMSRVRARFEVDLALRALFVNPTVAGLARAVEDAVFAGLDDAALTAALQHGGTDD